VKADDVTANVNKDKKATEISTITSSLGRCQVSLPPGDYIISVSPKFQRLRTGFNCLFNNIGATGPQVLVKPLGEFSGPLSAWSRQEQVPQRVYSGISLI
jgi:hypothetical protein